MIKMPEQLLQEQMLGPCHLRGILSDGFIQRYVPPCELICINVSFPTGIIPRCLGFQSYFSHRPGTSPRLLEALASSWQIVSTC